MQISEFMALEGEVQISADQAQQLNRNRSGLSAKDLPKDKIDHVLDYLIAALNVGAVDPQVRADIEKLASDLQDIR